MLISELLGQTLLAAFLLDRQACSFLVLTVSDRVSGSFLLMEEGNKMQNMPMGLLRLISGSLIMSSNSRTD